ncbi:HIT family protein [Alicycliphilus denitrificans]|uniref:Histidine triad (HIT) protein n=2 Tax=Alicycliphilus denitrificans TaxID=179636 RepID=F4G8P8_ALIDK|nr:HIT family protein [Alicycliphilus denitrificans]ADU98716.1 histidine triad (HIT) protein [Alicycliphilus denitrificans BC]AEB83325.1 histidine triad (HIT) protein [Alicycliphilus denitrificans K601]QKD43095.1 HIT family protein [Alicycliphilus denitrificans]GAO26802.1 histidine triad protein [Alicycliphilus sp. B1]
MTTAPACPLCDADGGALIWRGAQLRVIRAEEAGFPAFYRVIWNAHAAEFSDLTPAERRHCMEAVAIVEQALREQLSPAKINLATLGNVVPHLHWHVIARYEWDSHFPAPVWAPPQRASDGAHEAAVVDRLPALHGLIRERLDRWAAQAGA